MFVRSGDCSESDVDLGIGSRKCIGGPCLNPGRPRLEGLSKLFCWLGCGFDVLEAAERRPPELYLSFETDESGDTMSELLIPPD